MCFHSVLSSWQCSFIVFSFSLPLSASLCLCLSRSFFFSFFFFPYCCLGVGVSDFTRLAIQQFSSGMLREVGWGAEIPECFGNRVCCHIRRHNQARSFQLQTCSSAVAACCSHFVVCFLMSLKQCNLHGIASHCHVISFNLSLLSDVCHCVPIFNVV